MEPEPAPCPSESVHNSVYLSHLDHQMADLDWKKDNEQPKIGVFKPALSFLKYYVCC